ncbi:fimbrial biogenesis chaperone [Ramlibacter sp.]|uniref:fimbrial biogenesis chaperone n=1 Tax=Ramlibacter sp. TaxID=1917967 RepID=UPI002FC724A7
MSHRLERIPAAACTRAIALALTVVLAGTASPAQSGEFAVSPIRVDLKPGTLTETLTVSNHARMPLRVSVKLKEWSQDPQGADIYKDSDDLVYFPRQLDIPPQGRRLIRVGTRAPAVGTERAYRLFIEEEPAPGSSAGAQVSFYFRFGVPIFLPPPTGRAQPEVERIEFLPGKVQVRVRNPGSQHFRLLKVALSGDSGYAKEVGGWYSLAGSSRIYSFDFPVADCLRTKALRFTAEGEGVRLEEVVDVQPTSCR